MAGCRQFLSRVAPWTDRRILTWTLLVVVQTTLDWVQWISTTSTPAFSGVEHRIRSNNLRRSRYVLSNDELDDSKKLTSLAASEAIANTQTGKRCMLNKPAASRNVPSNFRFRKCSWSSVSVWKSPSLSTFLIKKVQNMPKVNRWLFEFLTADGIKVLVSNSVLPPMSEPSARAYGSGKEKESAR